MRKCETKVGSYYNISHSKAFGMINLQYEIRICQKYMIKSQIQLISGSIQRASEVIDTVARIFPHWKAGE